MADQQSGDVNTSPPPSDEGAAREIASKLLAGQDPDGECVITAVDEYPIGWVFFWNSRRYLATGDFRDSLLGNAPILVDRSDGSAHFTGTARTVDEYLRRYEARDPNDERSWHP